MLVPHLIKRTDHYVDAAVTSDDPDNDIAIVCRKLEGQSWEPLHALTPDGPNELPTCFELSRAAVRALDEILHVCP